MMKMGLFLHFQNVVLPLRIFQGLPIHQAAQQQHLENRTCSDSNVPDEAKNININIIIAEW